MALPEQSHESSNGAEVQICCAPQCHSRFQVGEKTLWSNYVQLFQEPQRGHCKSSEIKKKAANLTSTQGTITLHHP